MHHRIETPDAVDMPRLLEIWEHAVRATHDFLEEHDIQVLKPLLREQYFPLMHLACVRSTTGAIQGFIGCAVGKVEMLFVDPAVHGQGVGKALLRHAIERENATLVDVNEQNPKALAFYLSQGFEVFDRSPLDGGGRPFPILHMRLAVPKPVAG